MSVNSGGRTIRLHLGKVHRGTSKKFGAFLKVLFSLVLLCFEGRKSSKKLFRKLVPCKPRAPLHMGKNGTIWLFFLCFVSWHLEDTIPRCFVCQDSGHTQTPRICHIFVLSLLASRSTFPRNANSSWQTRNCQIVPVLPSYLYPPKFWGWQIHPQNLGGGVSEIPCFTVFLWGPPPKFRGWDVTP